MGPEQEGQGQEEKSEQILPAMEEIVSAQFLLNIGETRRELLRELLTEEGLRKLAHDRTIFILEYMSRPDINYKKNDTLNFNRLLESKINEKKNVIEPEMLWNLIDNQADPTKDQKRMKIVLDEIGKTIGLNINAATQELQSIGHRGRQISLQTDNPSYNVSITYKETGGFDYYFVKMVD